jgi:DNA mismatch endonuclease (patch repair protein)
VARSRTAVRCDLKAGLLGVDAVDKGSDPTFRRRPPKALDGTVRRRMQATKQRDTPGELGLRRTLHREGFRYTIDARALPSSRRRADLVFRRARVAVFVDGCFWHSCPLHGSMPKHNASWWKAKLAGNVRRDRDTDRELRAAGWVVVRVWAHEDPTRACEKVRRALAVRDGGKARPPVPRSHRVADEGSRSGAGCAVIRPRGPAKRTPLAR